MTRIGFVVYAIIICGGGFVAADEKRALSLDDLYRQEAVSDFTVSPRGDEAVYVRSWYDVNQPGRRTAIWRIDGATGRHEPLEAGEPDGRLPVYSPDGERLVFLSDRGSNGLKYATNIPNYSDRSGIIWNLRRVFPIPKEFRAPYGVNIDQVMTDPFYGRMTYSDNNCLLVTGRYDHSWKILNHDSDDQGEGYEGYRPPGFVLINFQKPEKSIHGVEHSIDYVGFDGYWYGDGQWTPDGKQIICHSNRTTDQESVRYSINKNYDLWRFTFSNIGWSSTAPPKQLTTNPGPDVSPRISPDGKHVLYLSVPRKGPHADVYNLCVLPLDRESAQPTVIVNAHEAEREADGTPPFQPTFPLRDDAWIDDEHVRVRGVRGMKGETRVFHIRGGEVAEAMAARAEPPPHENKHFRPPATNAWMSERFAAREEIVKWKSFDGLEIEGVLTLPPAELTEFQSPYPVIVYPHGGPHSASRPGFNFAVHLFAAKGYAVFQPNFRGTYGYGRKFLDAARFDMGGADMQDILTGVDMLIDRGTVDAKRQFVYGISYGGYSTCRLVTLTDRFRAAAAQNAVTDLHAMWALGDLQSWTEWEFGGKPWETVEVAGRTIDVGALMRDRSPTTHAHKVKTPTLVLHSDHDRRCPLAMGQMFHRHLKEAGCETELVVYKDERHGMWQVRHQADVLERVLDWFARHDR